MPATLLVHALNAKVCAATWDRVLFLIWRGEVDADGVAMQETTARQFTAEQGGQKFVFLTIIEPTSPPPPDHFRKDLARFFRELAAHTSEMIVVPEGGGFRPSLVRSVGIALSTFAPQVLPFRFVDSVTAACAVAAPRLSPSAGGPQALETAIEQTRTMLPPARRA